MISKRTGYFKSFDGTKIYYEVRGEGHPLVFAYGIGCLINHWNHQIDYFSKKYTTVVFDYRGHHLSELPENLDRCSIADLADDICEMLRHLEIQQASFIGHSFGAQVLMELYHRHPAIIHSMCFINGFSTNPLKGMFGNDLAEKLFQFIRNGFQTMPETFSQLYKAGVNNSLAIQLSALLGGFNIQLTHLKDIEIYARGISSMDLGFFLSMFENMLNYDGSEILKQTGVPVLVIGGKNDSVTPEKHQHEMYELIPESQFFMVPMGSHCSQLDMPDLVNLKIEDFLSSYNYSAR